MSDRRPFALLLVPFIALTGLAAAANGETDEGSRVVATVGGKTITLAEFEQKRPLALFQAKNAYFDAEKKAVDAYMDDFLLEQQAQKEHVSVQKLLEIHVDSTVAPDPTEESLKVYYEGIDTQESFEAIRDKIRDHLRSRRVAKAKQAYLKTLRDQATIQVNLAPPRAPVSIGKSPHRGAANAPLTLIEFADYECPYCQQMHPDLARAEEEFKGRITFAFKDMPLPMHGHAQKASEAAHCAGEQNKYWEFHDLLFNTKELELAQMKAGAKVLGLDVKVFEQCLDSGRAAPIVKSNLDEAMDLGLTGTPAFFLNGRFISGILPYDQLRDMLNEELRAAEHGTVAGK